MEWVMGAAALLAAGIAGYVGHRQRQARRADARRRLKEFVAARRPRRAPDRPGTASPSMTTGTQTVEIGHRTVASTATGVASADATATTAHGAGGDGSTAFTVRPPGDLPTFADVGGMEGLKQDLRDTVGLVLEHADQAEAYGITWNGILLHGPPGVGKTFVAQAVAGEFGLGLLHVSTGDLVTSLAGESARNVQRAFEAAAANRPSLLLLDEFDSIAQRRTEGIHAEERRTVNQLLTSLEEHRTTRGLVVMAATNDIEHLDPAVIRPGRFDRHVRIDLPDRAARTAILAEQLEGRPAHDDLDLDDLARRTDGFTAADIAQVADAAALLAFREAAGTGEFVRIRRQHLLTALSQRGGTDRPTVEDWDWEHIVLPADVRAELQQLQALIEDPELAASFGVTAPTGVLLAGPPGTGKTTIARVLAAQARCSFYPVSVADVTSKWVGESERSIQRLFQRARANRPSIVFLDEFDAIASARSADDGRGSRQVNQLLVEMDGLTGSRGVLVIAATNRPELLDPALVRGGRLSRTITIPLPDRADRLAMLRLMTRRMPTVGVDLGEVAAATDGMSGADLKAICQQAALHALVRARADPASGDAPTPAIHPADFERAVDDRRQSEQAGR